MFAKDPLPDSPHGRDGWYNTWVKPELPTREAFEAEYAVPGSTMSNFDSFFNAFQTQFAPFI
ncbi:hypothetical protein RISK_002835 [Rhodopirellula islandica]|uniref:Uncharacterized protein n=1 Tax=Rhodopirellula islandica TaxID=595434 RepID=A0A0J1BER7_RHOIS|nr:hypothetical protein RISK_002835 [Rhodopirellula islandica]